MTTKERRVTLNDVVMTVLSKTIYDYLQKYTEDRTTKSVNMAVPFSLRPPPTKLGEFTFDNNFAILNLNLRLVDTLGEGIKLISKDMADLKKSMSPISVYYIMNLCCWMPDAIRNLLLEDYADKMTFGFSNVPGPKEPYVVCDKKIIPINCSKDVDGSLSLM